ncbi:hypothetical protein A2961_02870 [Candidatus Woesebacteria bacterium RIFCSPLOWO2_01_FULL_39_21]|uniref:Uncharacterized protein n=1 Tax=Candidatus Woesebacteria bacterium RIFCSPLOWO2_01_FULL_39_21 TaxID=1802519 RepID=A0A1F8BMJ1_9BACT|nr:MAG: hypothetical protein A2691_01700 [Candidatus Woesebacteria bacterium RIFCSPHIGHO2_01_FULL_39_23]OGM64498.1 MAG: hypothetical protein A2961_02870 [Candidatus Woesebacteria bacterium RIFCSPLOWO2_01_FULL_39_21]
MNFFQISAFLVAASLGAGIAKLMKQPVIVGYLMAGIAITTLGLIDPGDKEGIQGLGQIGVTLLLFLVGIEMNLRELPVVGKTSIYTGIGQIFFTSILGFLFSKFLGFQTLHSLYLAIALTFSSTIVIVKLLSEKKDLGSLYGKISVGFLLVQDFVAVMILVVLSGMRFGELDFPSMVFVLVNALVFFAIILSLSRKVLPFIFDRFLGNSPELLFVSSLAWALGIASLVRAMGFSFEVGGFLAGLALSNLPEHLEVASKVRPLRDFFLAIFFIYLGSSLGVSFSLEIVLPVLAFSLFVLTIKPAVIMGIIGFLGYKKRTAFLPSLLSSQISEFSLIIVALGQSLGHLENSHVSIVVITGIITITISTYLVKHSEKIYKKFEDHLGIFEKVVTKEPDLEFSGELKDHVVIFGCHRTGKILTEYFLKNKISFIVVDFNPKVYEELTSRKIPVLFGDMADTDILERAQLEKSRVLISTVPDFLDNVELLEHIKKFSRKPLTIISSKTKTEAIRLYELGSDMVLVPEVVTGRYIKRILSLTKLKAFGIRKIGRANFVDLSKE